MVDWQRRGLTTETKVARVHQHDAQTVLRAEQTYHIATTSTDADTDTVGKRPLRYLFRRSVRNVIDNVDWHDVTRRLPGGQSRRGTKTFDFADCAASVVAVTVASGSVRYRTWNKAGFRITANVRVYGRSDSEPVRALLDHSVIRADADQLTFSVEDKRLTVDLDVQLPRRSFDHFDTQVLNGDVGFDDVHGQDFYVKLANGNLRAHTLSASMFEVENVNGDVSLRGLRAQDAVLSTVNGDLTVMGTVNALHFQTVNGVARADLHAAAETIVGASVNGNVSVSLPRTAALSGNLQTKFGHVVVQAHGVPDAQQAHQVELNRSGEKSGRLTLTTGAGDILLFDN
nr:DUF4097 family beta strand repeat-containing protein [Lacticaseibacillus thailandensis]